mmetsp:Transcript_2995/g.10802  ORF Transcript_2995/g.10802 Transcript_2995/m.10802 type:complete len:188 (-) Transcript_2995:82-645(-)
MKRAWHTVFGKPPRESEDSEAQTEQQQRKRLRTDSQGAVARSSFWGNLGITRVPSTVVRRETTVRRLEEFMRECQQSGQYSHYDLLVVHTVYRHQIVRERWKSIEVKSTGSPTNVFYLLCTQPVAAETPSAIIVPCCATDDELSPGTLQELCNLAPSPRAAMVLALVDTDATVIFCRMQAGLVQPSS